MSSPRSLCAALLVALCCVLSTAQFFGFSQPPATGLHFGFRQPPPHQFVDQLFAATTHGGPGSSLNVAPHPSVVENARRESQLPPELLKSARFYNNPHIARALAKESWITDKESAVVDRVAEQIPRDEVFKLFKNAGYIRRR